MANKTDLDAVKRTSKVLLHTKININEKIPVIAYHPFTNSPYSIDSKTGKMLNLMNKEDLAKWYEIVESLIDRAKKVLDIYILINTPYLLTFLKYIKDDLSKEEFSKLFAEAWVTSENPNGDANVSLRELVKMYKYCDKKCLMEKEDLEVFNNLPDEFVVYRGVSTGRNEKGLSYTRNKDKAEWFANRFGKGYVIEKTIKKENVLAYFNTRNEDEIVVNVYELQA